MEGKGTKGKGGREKEGMREREGKKRERERDNTVEGLVFVLLRWRDSTAAALSLSQSLIATNISNLVFSSLLLLLFPPSISALIQRACTHNRTRSTQHATLHASRSTLHAAHNAHHSARSTQHAARSTQHAARSTH